MPTNILSADNDTVAAGYYAETTLSTVDSDLTAGNIKKDVDIFGVTGTYEGGSAYPAPVPKTGQTISDETGDDGDLEKGVTWPSPRWTCYDANPAELPDCFSDDRVTAVDNLTGLQWTINANLDDEMKTWATAVSYCNGLDHGGYDDWRLPNRFELESLLDMSQYNPTLPSGHPFTSVQSSYYWSSTTYAGNTDYAWNVKLYNGYVNFANKAYSFYVCPVRAGQ